jgi:hypothetical protein
VVPDVSEDRGAFIVKGPAALLFFSYLNFEKKGNKTFRNVGIH